MHEHAAWLLLGSAANCWVPVLLLQVPQQLNSVAMKLQLVVVIFCAALNVAWVV